MGIIDGYDQFVLAISSKLFRDPEDAQKVIDRTIKAAKFAKSTTIKTIPYHEIRHMLECIYVNKNYTEEKKRMG